MTPIFHTHRNTNCTSFNDSHSVLFPLSGVHEPQCVSDNSHFHLFINKTRNIFKHTRWHLQQTVSRINRLTLSASAVIVKCNDKIWAEVAGGRHWLHKVTQNWTRWDELWPAHYVFHAGGCLFESNCIVWRKMSSLTSCSCSILMLGLELTSSKIGFKFFISRMSKPRIYNRDHFVIVIVCFF